MAMESECRLDRRQAAAFLTARGYRTAPDAGEFSQGRGRGRTFESFGRKPLYREADLLAWAKAKTTGPRRSTSDPGVGPSSGDELSASRSESDRSAPSREVPKISLPSGNALWAVSLGAYAMDQEAG